MTLVESKLAPTANGQPHSLQLLPPSPEAVAEAIIRTVAYADVFDYPLRPAELHRYLIGDRLGRPHLDAELAALLGNRATLREQDGTLFLPGREALPALRQERQALSDQLWPAAVHYGRLIARLPFVRMVAVTGSLSVNNVGDYRDVDYFIVTAPDALWQTRAMVISIVRLAARQGIELCPNYFITERALLIPDRDLYTAHEIAQMVPLSGAAVYDRFRAINAWTDDYLPNAHGAPDLPAVWANEAARPSATAESLLRTPPGRWFNAWEMERKIGRLGRATNGNGEAMFSADCCKGHFNNHQRQTLNAYKGRLARRPDRT